MLSRLFTTTATHHIHPFTTVNRSLPLSLTHNHKRTFSAGIVQHRNVPNNTQNDKFEFNSDNQAKTKTILAKFPNNYKQSAIIPLLVLAQEQNDNWLTLAAMNKVAEICNVPQIRVYEVATFYSQFNREKVGKHHLQVCGTTPCQLRGSELIMDTITKHVGIQRGETSDDGMFTMTEVECLGACANAPMLQINNHEFYENLDEQTTIKLLDDLKAGKKPHVGPQNGQKSCEGPQGQTTLKQPINDIKAMEKLYRNMDDVIKKEKEAQAAKKAEGEQKAKA